ncbi:hypothetical protein NPIL_4361 [Nephila pilipes]|uniref:Uncharacterized protein n=1 Tax=Nephila pilipes TaxID=299642 RepID=A0A8X6U9G8_NEPPI|nr:hypothetical protein NPIL_4361 [Nephila pilipes]
MKFSLLFFLTAVCVFFLGCAQAENCREFTTKNIVPIALSIIGREDAPACSETELYRTVLEAFNTEDESKYVEEYKKMYSELDEGEQKELKDCLNKVVEIILSEVGEVPEECEGRTQAWADSLTA